MQRWWEELSEQEARYAQQLWTWSEMSARDQPGEANHAFEDELEDEAALAVSRGMEMAAATICTTSSGTCSADDDVQPTTLLASTISGGRGLFVMVFHALPQHPAPAAAGPRVSLWRLLAHDHERDPQGDGTVYAARARRFSSPALVSSSEAAAEGGARAVWLVWSECVGSDPVEGAGGGWSGDGGSADCSSWLSQWLTSRSLCRCLHARCACLPCLALSYSQPGLVDCS